MEALACVKLSTVYNGRGDIGFSAEAAEDGLRLVPDDAAAIRLRLQGNLALTSAWLGEPLEASLRTLRRLGREALALGLDHFAAIAHHNLGVLQRDAGELDDSLLSLEKAATYWGELPNSPFADNSDLVVTLLALGQADRARTMADGSPPAAGPPPPPPNPPARRRSLSGERLLVLAVVEEPNLQQQVLVSIRLKESGEIVVGLESFGDPLVTKAVKGAVHAVVEWLTSRSADVKLKQASY
jgi:hypothetical protein